MITKYSCQSQRQPQPWSLNSDGSVGGGLGSISGFLRNLCLPYSNGNGAESGKHQSTGKPSQPSISFDLCAGEFMLLTVACLAGDLFLTPWFIEDDRLPFAMKWAVCAILFVVGQSLCTSRSRERDDCI
jgi:hypothetical protein